MNQAPAPSFFPGAEDVAIAYLWGSLVLAGTNALAITIGVPFPEAGLGLRVLHHAFEALETLGMGALGAMAALLLSRAAKLGGSLKSRRVGALFYASIAGFVMWALLRDTFERGAIQFGDTLGLEVPGFGERALLVLFFVLCAVGLPLLHAIGSGLGRRGLWGILPLAVGLCGMGLNRIILLDAYEDVHTVIQWGAACLVGAALTGRGNAQSGRLRRVAERAKTNAFLGCLAALALLACLVTPPNRVRFELFKDPGAAAAFVLAQTLWQLPSPHPLTGAAPNDPPDAPPSATHTVAAEVIARRERLPAKEVDTPVMVLVTVDALRGDVLARTDLKKTLPNFAELRDMGAYFPNAISPGSQTSTSLTTFFSGRYFSQLHWQIFGEGYDRRVYPALDPSPRFPELLTKAGVRTVALLSPGFLESKYGVVKGFAEQRVVSKRHAHAPSVLEPLLQRLGSHGLEPGFFYVHLMEPHEPYDRGKLKNGTPLQRYLSEVELLDPWIGRVMALIKEKFPKRGYLVLAADHGEAFGEHSTTFHSKTLYNELLHVPLVIWGPGLARTVHEERVGLIDLGPTILDLFGLPSWPGALGQSLVPLARSAPFERAQMLAAEGRHKRACFSENGLKVIEDDRHKTVEIYDLNADPKELRNLFESGSAVTARALEECRAFFREHTLHLPGYRAPYKR